MKFVDEYRRSASVRHLERQIRQLARRLRQKVRFMEVCGGHTMAIHRFGIPSLLPEEIGLVSGPGCPVCVTPTTYIDRAIELGNAESVILATFGDLYRVPGSNGTLEDAAGRGVDVRVVYSARDALQIAARNPEREVVFLAIGFETTAPTVAATVQEACAQGVENFRIMSGHKTMPQALRALVEGQQVALDGFILPGHVSTITGPEPYDFLPEEFGIPCCIAGFEPTDILRGILGLTEQLVAGTPRVQNAYRRAVRDGGNPVAREQMYRLFEPCDAQWRGLGLIPQSGLRLKARWKAYGVEPPDPRVPGYRHSACRCEEVLRGLARPSDCPLFGNACTPDSAVGPCMVSSEGACAACYKYGTGGFQP